MTERRPYNSPSGIGGDEVVRTMPWSGVQLAARPLAALDAVLACAGPACDRRRAHLVPASVRSRSDRERVLAAGPAGRRLRGGRGRGGGAGHRRPGRRVAGGATSGRGPTVGARVRQRPLPTDAVALGVLPSDERVRPPQRARGPAPGTDRRNHRVQVRRQRTHLPLPASARRSPSATSPAGRGARTVTDHLEPVCHGSIGVGHTAGGQCVGSHLTFDVAVSVDGRQVGERCWSCATRAGWP
jgi:hypothetical protein